MNEFMQGYNPERENIPEKKWNLKDFKGFIHFHSWQGSSCGREKIKDIQKAIDKKTGLEYIGFAEHVGWPGEEYWSEKILKEFEDIDNIQKENPNIKILKGVEVNVMKDGTIDGTDLIDKADIVVASHHYRNIEPESESTAEVTVDRWIKVMDNYPQVNVLGHPLRDLPEKEWSKVDWDSLCQKAKEKNVIIEIGISDSAVDHLPQNFFDALVKNDNLVVFAPDFHHLTTGESGFQKKDNWLGHRIKDLSKEQKELLNRYNKLKGNIAGKTFRDGSKLKGRKIDESPLSAEEEKEIITKLQKERNELAEIENSDDLREIYDILLLSEKTRLPNGVIKEKYPLSVATLMRFGRRMNRARKAGIKSDNLINLWNKEKITQWTEDRFNRK